MPPPIGTIWIDNVPPEVADGLIQMLSGAASHVERTAILIGESATNGRIYRSDMIVDWQGGFYYARIGVTF